MAEGPLKALLHDPQTAGGLLAAVPQAAAPGLLVLLRAMGLPAAQIGTTEAGPVRVTVQ